MKQSLRKRQGSDTSWSICSGTSFRTTRKSDHPKRVAPEEGFLKINADGAFSERGARTDAVVRIQPGQIDAIMAERIHGVFNAEHC